MAFLKTYFDYGSPNSYFVHAVLPGLLRRTGATARHRIVLLGGIFKALGSVPPHRSARAYSRIDFDRFVERYGVPFRTNPHFPVNSLNLMRGAIVAEEEGFLDRYSDAVYRGMWHDALDMAEGVFAGVLKAAGLDHDRVMRRIEQRDVKVKLKELTDEAVSRGVFGVPTIFVGQEMFFGKDRLDFVERALQRACVEFLIVQQTLPALSAFCNRY